MIDVKHLSKSFGDHLVLDDISEHIASHLGFTKKDSLDNYGRYTYFYHVSKEEEPKYDIVRVEDIGDGELELTKLPTGVNESNCFVI